MGLRAGPGLRAGAASGGMILLMCACVGDGANETAPRRGALDKASGAWPPLYEKRLQKV